MALRQLTLSLRPLAAAKLRLSVGQPPFANMRAFVATPRWGTHLTGGGRRSPVLMRAMTSDAPEATGSGGGFGAPMSTQPAVYTNYTVYKGTGAVSFKVIKPSWSHVRDSNYITIDRPGVLFLEFAKGSDRAYDWANKQTFAMSVTELGGLLSWGAGQQQPQGGGGAAHKPLDFFHDPGKMKNNEGQITKSLRLSEAPSGDVFMALRVREAGREELVYNIALSRAELTVVKVLAEYLIPRLLGIDETFYSPPEVQGGAKGGAPGPHQPMQPPF